MKAGGIAKSGMWYPEPHAGGFQCPWNRSVRVRRDSARCGGTGWACRNRPLLGSPSIAGMNSSRRSIGRSSGSMACRLRPGGRTPESLRVQQALLKMNISVKWVERSVMITNAASETNIKEIADGNCRINTPLKLPDEERFSFNQYLVVDVAPPLFHTGQRKTFHWRAKRLRG